MTSERVLQVLVAPGSQWFVDLGTSTGIDGWAVLMLRKGGWRTAGAFRCHIPWNIGI
jgi:hypothetical protein